MKCKPRDNIDRREALYNEGRTGSIVEVQLPVERITTLLGFMLDLDPQVLAPDNPFFRPAEEPADFLRNIEAVLARHPVARTAEVRATGTGLHLVVRFKEAVELRSAAAQHRWNNIIQVVQCSLPSDPTAPGINRLTRPVGSVNSKNGRTVEMLKAGEPIESGLVEAFVCQFEQAPFKQLVLPLLGNDRISPCPVCRGPGTRLDVLDRAGQCYGRCGTVSLEQVLDAVYAPLESAAAAKTAEEPAPPEPPKADKARGRKKRK